MLALVFTDPALLYRAHDADVSIKMPKIPGSVTRTKSQDQMKPASKQNPDPADA